MDHDDPIEIDLGMAKAFDVELVLASLRSEGVEVAFYPQRDVPELGTLGPMRCRILVRPSDEARVREELVEAELL
jgi:hypothetical protein